MTQSVFYTLLAAARIYLLSKGVVLLSDLYSWNERPDRELKTIDLIRNFMKRCKKDASLGRGDFGSDYQFFRAKSISSEGKIKLSIKQVLFPEEKAINIVNSFT
ncbi:MAG TPA: hypothetical protein V6D10_08025 [Trichocoleus sp.]|jgi:hypothetical protein